MCGQLNYRCTYDLVSETEKKGGTIENGITIGKKPSALGSESRLSMTSTAQCLTDIWKCVSCR